MKYPGTTIKQSVRTLAGLTLCFSFGILGPYGTMMSTSVHAQEPVKSQKLQLLVSNSRVRQATYQANATKYDAVMRNLGALEQAPLKTEADAKRVIGLLQKNQISNDLILGKGFTIAVNVPSFRQGVRAEADRVSINALARQVNQKSIAHSRIGGFNDLKTSLKQQFDADSATLSRLGQRLQTASRQHGISEMFKEGNIPTVARHSHSNPAAGFSFVSAQFQRVPDGIGDAILMNADYSAKSQFDPLTFSIFLGVILAVEAVLIISGAWENQKDLEEDPNTDVSQLGACQDDAKAKRDACLDKHPDDFWGQAGCWGAYTVDEAACLILHP